MSSLSFTLPTSSLSLHLVSLASYQKRVLMIGICMYVCMCGLLITLWLSRAPSVHPSTSPAQPVLFSCLPCALRVVECPFSSSFSSPVLSAAVPDEKYLFRFFVGQGGAGVLAAVCGILPYLVKRFVSARTISTFSFLQTVPGVLPFPTDTGTTTSSSSSSSSSMAMLQLDLQHQSLESSGDTAATKSAQVGDHHDEEVRWSLYSSIFVFSVCIFILLVCAFSYRALKSSRLFAHLLERPAASSSSPHASGAPVSSIQRRRVEGEGGGDRDDGERGYKQGRTRREEGEDETMPLAADVSPPHRRNNKGPGSRRASEEREGVERRSPLPHGDVRADTNGFPPGRKERDRDRDEDSTHLISSSTGKEKIKSWADKRVQAETRNAFLVFFVSGVLFPGT